MSHMRINSFQCSVLPSPTPIIPILEDETTKVSDLGKALFSIKAEIRPAVPEPTIPILNCSFESIMSTMLPENT